jgi:ATP-dependent Clp protease, protease subunit
MTPQIKMRLANKGRGDFRAEDNTIWLYDAIASDEDEAMWFGGVSPRDFIAALARTTGPVTLRINSPGGSVFGAQAMVAAMRDHGQPITARVDSLAASAASVIAAECAECEMVPGSMMMIHKAWGLAVGNSDDMLATAELLEKIDGQIAAAYSRRAGDDKDWAAMMAAETWFTAEEALGVGLVSRVADENKQRPANRWDLSAFAKAPVIETAPEAVTDDAPAKDLRATRARQLAARLAASAI